MEAKVFKSKSKDTQVLNSAILLSVKRILFPGKLFYNIDIMPLNLSNLCMRQESVTVNQLVCILLLLSKTASKNLARAGCSASDFALHEAGLWDFVSDSSSCYLSACKWVGRERVWRAMVMSWEIRQGSDRRTEEDVGRPSFSFSYRI